MTRYLLSLYQPDGPVPEPEVLDKIMTYLDALNAELKTAGAGSSPAACIRRAPRPYSGRGRATC